MLKVPIMTITWKVEQHDNCDLPSQTPHIASLLNLFLIEHLDTTNGLEGIDWLCNKQLIKMKYMSMRLIGWKMFFKGQSV